jgi:hypothetical protein
MPAKAFKLLLSDIWGVLTMLPTPLPTHEIAGAALVLKPSTLSRNYFLQLWGLPVLEGLVSSSIEKKMCSRSCCGGCVLSLAEARERAKLLQDAA